MWVSSSIEKLAAVNGLSDIAAVVSKRSHRYVPSIITVKYSGELSVVLAILSVHVLACIISCTVLLVVSR